MGKNAVLVNFEITAMRFLISNFGSTNKEYSCNKLFALETEKCFLGLLTA
jgi:hypothetical protein